MNSFSYAWLNLRHCLFLYHSESCPLTSRVSGIVDSGKTQLNDSGDLPDVDVLVAAIEDQKKEARELFKDGEISASALDKELDDSDKLSTANIKSLDKWKDILDKIGSQDEFIKNVKGKKKIIKYKQKKAKIQISTLKGIKNSQSIEESIGMIDNLIGSVEDLDLLVLNEDVVNELLGIGDINE